MGHRDKKSPAVEIEISSQDVRGLETMMRGILAAAFYGVCSVSSAFVTKTLMDTLRFDFPVTIMVAQMVFSIAVLETLSVCKVVSLPAYTLKRGLSFAWPALFYGANAVLALSALAHMNIAMYGVLKRCVPISTMMLSVLVLGKGWPTRPTMATVCMLSIGCVVAGYGDMSFNLMAYACGIGSNFTQALYLLLVQRVAQTQKLSTVETLQLNCFNALPILALAAVVNGEVASLSSYPASSHPYFPVAFLATVSVGMLLNYSLFLCTGLTSALTTSVVGGLKAMVQTLLGLVTFGGVSHNLPTYLGIALNLAGGTGYIAVKYRENNARLKGLHKVMSFSSFSSSSSLSSGSKGGGGGGGNASSSSSAADHRDGHDCENGFVPQHSEDPPEGFHVKERHQSQSESSELFTNSEK